MTTHPTAALSSRSRATLPRPARVEPLAQSLDLRSLRSFDVEDDALLAVARLAVELFGSICTIALPEPTTSRDPKNEGPMISLSLGRVDNEAPVLGRRADDASLDSENYRLTVNAVRVEIVGTSPEGVFRGLVTLLQLATVGDGVVTGVRLVDAPRYAWRGISLDVARTFFPRVVIKRVLDLLALYKFNVLHLHLADDQGWRLEIPAWPLLTSVGARGAFGERAGGFYTQSQFRELVAYARARFITIVPELDMPGHTGAVLEAYPEMRHGEVSGGPGDMIRIGHLSATSAEVHRFVEDVFTDLACLIDGRYIHIGGDEAFGMNDDDHAAFVTRAARTVRAAGKKVVGWQEASRGDLGEGAIAQYWIDFARAIPAEGTPVGATADIPADVMAHLIETFRKASGDVERFREKALAVIASPTGHAYLDRPHLEASVDQRKIEGQTTLGRRAYPPTALSEYVDWDPSALPDLEGVEIAGIEAPIWCETVADENELGLLLLPRLAGIASVGWTGPEDVKWAEYSQALASHAVMWERLGWSWYAADSVPWPAK